MAENRPPPTPAQLERAAASLRPFERKVLVLSAREGLPTGEIARRLGTTPDAVERILARAVCRLDRALERQARPWWRFWCP